MTPILGCNMAILVAIRINCIYVWSLTNDCIWNGAIGSCILLNVLQYDVFAMHVKTNATTIWLQAQILRPAEWLRELLLQRNTWMQYESIAMNEFVTKSLYCHSIVMWEYGHTIMQCTPLHQRNLAT